MGEREVVDMLMGSFLQASGMGDMISGFFGFLAFWGVLISAIQAFFGYKLMRFWIVVNGIMIGLVVGPTMGFFIGSAMESYSAVAGWTGFGLIAGAVLGGIIAHKLWKVGVFFLCFSPCFLVAFILFMLMSENGTVGIIFGLLAGCAGGYYGVKFVKPVVIIITSVVNGLSAGLALLSINPFLGIVVSLICMFGGFYFQCVTNGHVFGVGTGNFSFGNIFKNEEGSGGLSETAASVSNSLGGITSGIRQGIGTAAEAIKKTDQTEVFLTGSGSKISLRKNSKLRSELANTQIRTRNDNEYFFKSSPVVLPQIQIADVDSEGNVGLYLSIQNITEQKRVIALYFDIHCYNVLKEKLAELTDIPILDLSIEAGEISEIEKAIRLPDKSIRRCELIPRHVIFSDDDIWDYEGKDAFFMASKQEKLVITEPGLRLEFKKAVEENSSVQTGDYGWQPVDFGDYWYCGCGQLNTGKSCVCCKIEKSAVFKITGKEYLEARYKETQEKLAAEREEQERLRQEREAERKRKLSELQDKTKLVLGAASEKGKEVISKAGDVGRQAADTIKKQTEEISKKIEEKSGSPEISLGGTLTCNKCGAVCSTGDKFCVECGNVLPNDFKQCKSCGFINTPDSKFCMNCGAKQEEGIGEE